MAKKISIKGPIVGNDVGWLYHWLGWDCCCPGDVEAGLQEAAGEDVILEINSPGGYCDYGSEIYTLLMGYEGNIEAHIMMAASAATVIACAADKALASDTMVYMIHNASGKRQGDYRDMINASECLEKYNEAIINAYIRKTGRSREELQTMMDHTTWMSAEDAIKHGFVDDYLFGNPNGDAGKEQAGGETGKEPDILQAMNAMTIPVIKAEKAMELCWMIKQAQTSEDSPKDVDTVKSTQDDSSDADSDIAPGNKTSKGGRCNMTLEEFLEENPEAKAELDVMLEASAEAGRKEENGRLRELDEISASVSTEELQQAKYGESPMDAKSLAYQSLVKDGKKAKAYIQNAMSDSRDSNVDEVMGSPSDTEEAQDESDALAAIANKKLEKHKS